MRRAAWALAVLAVAACAPDESSSGTTLSTTTTASTTTASTTTTTTTTALAGSVTPVGFEQVAATSVAVDGTVCELCLWLADTAELRSQGLMGVTDLGGADGMLFRYEVPRSTMFWMKDTVMPLSIAYYAGDGSYLDAYDMQPCTANPCPHYRTAPDFVVAIEVAQGDLEALGLTPGSTLQVSDTACGV